MMNHNGLSFYSARITINRLYDETHILNAEKVMQWLTFEIKSLEKPRIVSNQNVVPA